MERDLLLEIESIINSGKSDEEIREALADYHENDIASVVHDLSKEDRDKLYKFLSDEELADIFSYIDDVEDYIDELPVEKAADIIEEMDADDAIDVLLELDEEDKNQILEEMDKEAVEDIKLIRQYDEDQIGSKMTNNFIVIKRNMNIKQAMKAVVESAAEHDNVSTIFVLDDNDKYYGSIELRDLIIARSNQSIEEIVKTAYPSLQATTPIDECIQDLKDYALDIIPVLNDKNELIGVITSDDIIETVDEEMSEDYVKLAGIVDTEELDESVIKSVTKRIPWLLALLCLGLVTSLLISGFHSVVAALPALVFFQSLILDMSGNSGTQSLAVTIRTITAEDVDKKLIAKTIGKETTIGLSNGLILGSLSFVAVFTFLYLTKTTIVETYEFSIETCLLAAMCVSIALLCAMTISTFSGSVIPILFKKINIDPAVASGPFITTLNDIIAVAIYYGLASLLFAAFLG